MKHLREYNNWVSDVTDNITVNYGDEKPKLSDIVIDVIKFIEDNYDKIDGDINSTRESQVGFEDGLELKDISIGIEEREKNNRKTSEIPYLHFMYNDSRDMSRGYRLDITNYDYDYLKNYFYKIFRVFRKKQQDKEKERYKEELQKIEDNKVKEITKKNNPWIDFVVTDRYGETALRRIITNDPSESIDQSAQDAQILTAKQIEPPNYSSRSAPAHLPPRAPRRCARCRPWRRRRPPPALSGSP